MAAIAPVVTNPDSPSDKTKKVVWGPMAVNDTCDPISLHDHSDCSVQFSGTFGGATIELHGSNNGSNFLVLTDPQGNNISKTAAAMEMVTEMPNLKKPVLTGGNSLTQITATLFCRKTKG